MQAGIAETIEKIAELPPNWHGAGSVSVQALKAIATHASRVGPIEHSVETGSGKTTLLFSHLSADHLAFAVDAGNSISQVRNCPLFKRDTVKYVEGPTQLTLPSYNFTSKVQIALIDGPHGYPFPDLEYYYFYPLIAPGGLLLVDDIQIPSIARMSQIIEADEMFELLDVVDDNMSIFRRTDATLIDPEGDAWWLQGYNRAHYANLTREDAPVSRLNALSAPILKKTLRSVSGLIPRTVKSRLPNRVKQRLWSKM
jgi:Methyltransferase domain